MKLAENTKLIWYAESGDKKRTSTIYSFLTKAYDGSYAKVAGEIVLNKNHLVQTTELNQPRLRGNIAPNETLCAYSGEGETRLFTHPDIVVSGTYTIVKCLNQTGKAEITFTEVTTGTYNSLSWTGRLYYYRIQAGIMTAEQQADEAAMIRSWLPEVESVVIGSQELTTSNLDTVATVQGNVIANVTENGAVEKITGGNFESGLIGTLTSGDETSTWTLNTTSPIADTQDALLQVTATGAQALRPKIEFVGAPVVGKWYKVSITHKVNSGTCVLEGYFDGLVGKYLNQTLTGSAIYTFYYKAKGVGALSLYFENANLFNVQIDNISIQELNWSNATEIYAAVYAATVGDAAAKEYAALKEAAMWCYYQNDPANGAIYGKILNKYAIALLSTDIAAYNAANPTAHWGWHLPTRTELTTLAAQGGNACKMTGEDYWTTDNGLNTNGLTLFGSGYRMADGTFADIKAKTGLIAADADFARVVVDGDDTFVEEAITTEGYPARLIKD